MKTDLFDYQLPPENIAQFPSNEREQSRLLCFNRNQKTTAHKNFFQLPSFLKEGDVLVLNDTKVIPARLFGLKAKTHAKIEVFLLEEVFGNSVEDSFDSTEYPFKSRWKVLLKPGKRIKPGDKIFFQKKQKVSESFFAINPPTDLKNQGTTRELIFYSKVSIYESFSEYGVMPLPPYIKREASEEDKEKYQTVFAKKEGAVAAPTASLHFSSGLLEKIKSMGVLLPKVTLHVGYDTFRPVEVSDIENHQLHSERFEISSEAVSVIQRAKREGRRVIACGTTVVRALESAINSNGDLLPGKKKTNIFIYPPYNFKIIDGLITNFHLPKSSLLMLVCAFGGHQPMMNLYQQALQENYRFYSYGDAMFIF